MLDRYRKPLPLATSFEVTTPPTWQLLDIPDVRRHLRLPDYPGAQTDMNEDEYLTALIETVGEAIETHTRRPIRAQTRVYVVDATRLPDGAYGGYNWRGSVESGLVFNSGPWRVIRAIRYRNNDVETTLPAADYRVEGLGGNVRRSIEIYPTRGEVWPWISGYNLDDSPNIEVEVDCGFASAVEVPPPLKHAARIMVGDWYNRRGQMVVNASVNQASMSARYLLRQYTRKL